MTVLQRVRASFRGLLMILMSIILVLDKTEDGFEIISIVLSLWLLMMGIRSVIYYFRMARHMVGGRMMLYKGIVLLDFAAFAAHMSSIPVFSIVLYLLCIHAFSGAVDVMRALESKRIGTPAWKMSLMYGIVNIGVAISAAVAGFAFGSLRAVVYIYASGLFYNGAVRIAKAFRKTAIVYIQ